MHKYLAMVFLVGCAASPMEGMARIRQIVVPSAEMALQACAAMATARIDDAVVDQQAVDASNWGKACTHQVYEAYEAAALAYNLALAALRAVERGTGSQDDADAAVSHAETAVEAFRTVLLQLGIARPFDTSEPLSPLSEPGS